MAYLGMIAFGIMFIGVALLAKLFTKQPPTNQTIDIGALWQKVSKNINQQAKVNNAIMQQAIALQTLDLPGSVEQNVQVKQDIYNEYYCGCRLLILSLLPEDATQVADDSHHNVVPFAPRVLS